MIKHEREQLNNEDQRQYVFLRFGNGCLAVVKDWKKAILLVAYVILVVWLIDIGAFRAPVSAVAHENLMDVFPLLGQIMKQILIILGAPIVLFMILVAFGTPFGSRAINGNLMRTGLVNSAGEAPVLIGKSKGKPDKRIITLEFRTNGIPLKEWEDRRLKIEAALNMNIVKIMAGKNKRYVVIKAVSAKNALPDVVNWQDSYLNKDNFVLVLGESMLGVETVDLSVIPHILLGGATGSGKSVLLKLLVMQCIKKGAIVTIADFKGGVDFPYTWHKHCQIVTEENTLLEVLAGITEELERRKILLRDSGCANIDDFNRHTKSELHRQIFVCDEVAEILDKTGLDKSQKELISNIESKLATIARQGRAFGIHLILATQRPDATILSGQIRNNINFRVCGRADNVLSQIILDNTSATDSIQKDAQGRFITHEGVVFQGYWFDEYKALG